MLTLPNLLTLSRIFAVPILVFLLWKPSWFDYAITFVLYCLVGLTDYFDGYLARRRAPSRGSACSSIRLPTRSWSPPSS
jgi:phosphatidylglycerophosphate synthase